jgi:hypothetical protein
MNTDTNDEPTLKMRYFPSPWYWPTERGLEVLAQNEAWIPEDPDPQTFDARIRAEARELAMRRHAASQNGEVSAC